MQLLEEILWCSQFSAHHSLLLLRYDILTEVCGEEYNVLERRIGLLEEHVDTAGGMIREWLLWTALAYGMIMVKIGLTNSFGGLFRLNAESAFAP